MLSQKSRKSVKKEKKEPEGEEPGSVYLPVLFLFEEILLPLIGKEQGPAQVRSSGAVISDGFSDSLVQLISGAEAEVLLRFGR